MKFMFIGDLHGTPIVKELEKNKDFKSADEVIFMGDYFDSEKYTTKEILKNFTNLLELKEKHNKIKLLIGNHELHYFLSHTPLGKYVKASGYRSALKEKAYSLYIENANKFSAAWQYENILATHAGLSNCAYEKYIKPVEDGDPGKTLAEKLNQLWMQLHSSLFHISFHRGGSSQYGSIFWADIRETMDDPLENYHQVVGHNRVPEIITINKNSNTSITYIDTIEDKEKLEYYLIER